MADIGPIRREIIIEPVPEKAPIVEPSPVPATPKKEPVPA